MSSKTLSGIVAAVIGIVIACTMGGAILVGGAIATCTITAQAATPLTPPPGGWPTAEGLDAEQVGNAATIVSVGVQTGVPTRGWIIAVATAIQESGLRNLSGGDRDSVGLFQQRPSQGWGTPQQLHDPTYAAGRFYQKLLTVPGWQNMPLTQAAQAVQRSAYPNAYARHEAAAAQLVNTTASLGMQALSTEFGQCVTPCMPTSASTSVPSPSDDCHDGQALLARAAAWLTAWHNGPVPYLSSPNPANWLQGYRRDCSGYVSMALGLPGPGLTTVDLAARSTPIPKEALSAGDLLINPAPNLAGHVVIFDHWADTTMTSYVGYEQSGDGGTHHRVIPYPYFGSYRMSPYRFRN